jgi:hypothetical protein
MNLNSGRTHKRKSMFYQSVHMYHRTRSTGNHHSGDAIVAAARVRKRDALDGLHAVDSALRGEVRADPPPGDSAEAAEDDAHINDKHRRGDSLRVERHRCVV